MATLPNNKKNPNWEGGQDKKGGTDKIPPFFKNKQFHFSIWYFIIFLVLLSLFNSYYASSFGEKPILIDYTVFKQKIDSGEIKRVEIGDKELLGVTETIATYDKHAKNATFKVYQTYPVADPQFMPLLDSKHVEYTAIPQNSNFLQNILFTWVLPFVVIMLIWRFMFKRVGGNLGSNVLAFGQNKSRIVAEGDVKVSFDDVAGADESKEELMEVVDFLKNPDKYRAIGGRIPKGVLLVGPPGGGKTLMARAVAGEAKVTFFKISGADFVEMFVGVGAARVRDLFKQAREKAPCIIFIDELDAIGKSRVNVMSSNDEREQTLNQLLVEMDGFDSTQGVIILAATNRPEILDPALMRAGRFDRQVVMDRPDLAGREAILKIHAKDVKLDASVDLNQVAKSTPGFVGADLENVINEAALLAVRLGRKSVAMKDFDEAIEKIVAGLQKKNRVINPKEKKIVAYHETGHALVAAFTPGADPVHKITIVPRGISALGYTMQLPTEDRYLMTSEELLGKIDVLLGGRASEQLIFKQVSTGAANDLNKATEIAKKMITDYGMSGKFRNVVLISQKGPSFLGNQAELMNQREYSESTQQYIDEEITRMVNERYELVLSLLKSKLETLETVAQRLLEVESLDQKEFRSLIKQSAGVKA